VEGVSKDIITTPTAGTFSVAAITTKETVINLKSNTFYFDLMPEDEFRNEAIIKIVFPRELEVRTDMSITNDLSFMSSNPTVKVEFNR
jgi:hypothetical protein